MENICNKMTKHPSWSVIFINLLVAFGFAAYFPNTFFEKNLLEPTSEHVLKLPNCCVKYACENPVEIIEYVFERVNFHCSKIAGYWAKLNSCFCWKIYPYAYSGAAFLNVICGSCFDYCLCSFWLFPLIRDLWKTLSERF